MLAEVRALIVSGSSADTLVNLLYIWCLSPELKHPFGDHLVFFFIMATSVNTLDSLQILVVGRVCWFLIFRWDSRLTCSSCIIHSTLTVRLSSFLSLKVRRSSMLYSGRWFSHCMTLYRNWAHTFLTYRIFARFLTLSWRWTSRENSSGNQSGIWWRWCISLTGIAPFYNL